MPLHTEIMSKKTTIYVMFREYPDNGRLFSRAYIQASEEFLLKPEALLNEWNEISEILGFFNYEIANRYYDEENLDGLLYVAAAMPNEYPGVETTILTELANLGLTPWTGDAATKTSRYGFRGNDVTGDMLGDMAQREIDHLEVLQRVKHDVDKSMKSQEKEYEPCVLLQSGVIETIHDEVVIDLPGGQQLKLKSVDSICGLHEWLSLHRFPYRQLDANPKHGVANLDSRTFTNRHGKSVQAAQLLSLPGETKCLLKRAVGCTVGSELWLYDDRHGCYIYFENQGDNPQHAFHGYHLNPGDKNFENINVEKLRKIQLIP